MFASLLFKFMRHILVYIGQFNSVEGIAWNVITVGQDFGYWCTIFVSHPRQSTQKAHFQTYCWNTQIYIIISIVD